MVGAGPAGSTTARFCADKDTEVLMIDRRREIGYPVQCGELLPATKEMYSIFPRGTNLEELFDIDDSLTAGSCSSVEFISPGGRVYSSDFVSHALDRRIFDKHLVSLAIERGARVEKGVSLTSIEDGVANTTIGEVRAKVIVGADGPNSLVARQAGLQRPSARYPAITCRAEGQFGDAVKMFFGMVAPGGYAWIIPKTMGANVGLGLNRRTCREQPSVALRRFVDNLGCRVTDVALGFVPMSGPVSSTVNGNVMLVGDAAGHTMASNGGGIPTAMIAGRLAGRIAREHVANGNPLSTYEEEWRRVMYNPLSRSLRTKRFADFFFSNDRMLGLAMAILGNRGLDRAIRCKRLFL
ncbi:MAG: geranylgeranyl reductase family protein [Candidatus Thermoplasmatota archaeon]|nr:geranylgeranyl reductase family protein [Candidatus Thermoplasmatota archaeon]